MSFTKLFYGMNFCIKLSAKLLPYVISLSLFFFFSELYKKKKKLPVKNTLRNRSLLYWLFRNVKRLKMFKCKYRQLM